MAVPRLSDNKTLQILLRATDGGYGVLAAIAYNLEHVLGFIRAAEMRRSPLIIQLFPWAVRFSHGTLVHAAAIAAKQATVPVAIHLDHCQNENLVKEACDLPFDSIMIDMSHLSKDENLKKTMELVSYCSVRGKATEAEPGRIEGGEDGIANTVDLSGLMTSATEAQQFIDAGVHILAPSFGNVHGEYGSRGIVLEYDRLEEIRRVTSQGSVFIALHGVNRFPEALTRRLIAAGVTKINVNRDVLMEYYTYMEEWMNKIPFTQLLEESVDIVARSMGQFMDIVMSSGRA
ncbi:tagatose-bisphosphate aldolase [Xylaria curta]|nr:tagatose-bisphosphate aldolase [Xylaria curta]